MGASTRSPWGREYARRPWDYVWGTEPSTFASDISAFVPPGGRVLDAGCGEGRDSVFFASRGFSVTGVDLSTAGLRKGERLAATCGSRVRWVRGDIARFQADHLFDLVYSCGSIHYVPRPKRTRLFVRLKALTHPGGYHAHVVFTDRLIYVEKGEVIDYFAPGELASAYADWIIVRGVERTIVCAQDGIAHRHGVEELIARAPG